MSIAPITSAETKKMVRPSMLASTPIQLGIKQKTIGERAITRGTGRLIGEALSVGLPGGRVVGRVFGRLMVLPQKAAALDSPTGLYTIEDFIAWKGPPRVSEKEILETRIRGKVSKPPVATRIEQSKMRNMLKNPKLRVALLALGGVGALGGLIYLGSRPAEEDFIMEPKKEGVFPFLLTPMTNARAREKLAISTATGKDDVMTLLPITQGGAEKTAEDDSRRPEVTTLLPITKQAAEDTRPLPKRRQMNIAAGQATREKPYGFWLDPHYIGETQLQGTKSSLKSLGIGAGVGAGVGTITGLIAAALSKGRLKLSRTAAVGAGAGALSSGLVAGGVGDIVGQVGAGRKYLARKGIKTTRMGSATAMTPEAAKTYLRDKYRGGGLPGPKEFKKQLVAPGAAA